MFKQKETSSRWRFRLIFALLAVLVVFLGYRLLGEWQKRQETEDEIARLEKEAKELENRNLEILDLSKKLTTEEMVESEGRLKLGLQKPGESVAILSKDDGVAGTHKKEMEGSRGGNIKRWWFYFFDQGKFNALKEERKARGGVGIN